MMDFGSFEALTFDCYGTLVDWERGILEALSPVLAAHGADAGGAEAALERFARLESGIQVGRFRSYRSVLEEVMRAFGAELGFRPSPGEVGAFAASVPSWPPFADTVPALRALARRYRLAVVSNVDDDLFAGTARRLEVTFSAVVTAQQLRSYKPARAHFDEVLRRLDLPRERVLHVAQSLFHDIGPATALGFRCVWVNRRAGRSGSGATSPATAVPDLEVPDLATLVARTGLGA
ncbi:MAG: haloacid dehalogenase type II [Gemmatimonadetes bacterium]|nr:haloacid dehalogenase type II [Gemmatimonadota bacterium]